MNKNNSFNIYTMFFLKLLISIVVMLVVLILIKSSSKFKNDFYKRVYSSNISFTYINEIYNKYIGSNNFNIIKTEPVFNEKLSYNKKEKYLDGVNLYIDKNYLVHVNESGIVVFIGEKESYGNTVIIQRIDGVDEWYGNINNVNVELYDYVRKGSLLGEASNNLYLVYKKDGNVLNYEEFFE